MAHEHGKIYLHDIGDYLTREEKLEKIAAFGSIAGISKANGWLPITPDQHNDWVKQRDDSFGRFIVMGDKKEKRKESLFRNFSLGVSTNRDAWVLNSSKRVVASNMAATIDFYNAEVDRFERLSRKLGNNNRTQVDETISNDSSKISWSSGLKSDLGRFTLGKFRPEAVIKSLYRPFQKQWLYFDGMFNERTGQIPKIFPSADISNRVIYVSGVGAGKGFSSLMTDLVPNLHMLDSGQCFPLELYEAAKTTADDTKYIQGANSQNELFNEAPTQSLFAKNLNKQDMYVVSDGITDAGLLHFKDAYRGEQLSKECLFYYIYGLLHSEDYKKRYADNLSKELPRIPVVKKFADFQAFSAAGRKLADLHVNYETVVPYPVTIDGGALLLETFAEADYRVTQMKFASKGDKTRVVYNHKITMSDIPLEAYDYVVNGKPALEWVMERQAVTTNKDSGIVNDANLWASETIGDAAYPLKLFQRVITVSLETMKIVRSLPRLDISVGLDSQPRAEEVAGASA
jgi:predicted helicase